jgi:uncharacterized membrane protein YkvA (DUF1232 family)
VWVEVVAVGLVVVVAVWMALFLLARVMPPGRTREYVAFAPNCVILLGRLRRDSRLPWRSRLVLAAGLGYLVSPIQLIPNFLPVIGQTDDFAVLTCALRYACRHLPPEAVRSAWPGDPRQLDRLLGVRGAGGDCHPRADGECDHASQHLGGGGDPTHR